MNDCMKKMRKGNNLTKIKKKGYSVYGRRKKKGKKDEMNEEKKAEKDKDNDDANDTNQ